jgi:hypothetical protein
MPIFEPDSGRPRLVQPMQPLAGTFLGEVRTLLAEHLGAVVGEPLFPVRARAALPEHTDVPELLALDVTGRPVVLEVAQVVDDGAIVAALRHAGAAARLTTADLARAYHPDPTRFSADYAAFRDQVPFARPAELRYGTRLVLLCSEVAAEAVDTLAAVRGPGWPVRVLQIGVVRGPDGGRLLDVSPLASYEQVRRPVEPTSLRLVHGAQTPSTMMPTVQSGALAPTAPPALIPTQPPLIPTQPPLTRPVGPVTRPVGPLARPQTPMVRPVSPIPHSPATLSAVAGPGRHDPHAAILAAPPAAVPEPFAQLPYSIASSPDGLALDPAVSTEGPLRELAALAAAVRAPAMLVWVRERRGQRLEATLRTDGMIQLPDGAVFADPDVAAARAVNAEGLVDGWRAWRLGDGGPTLAEVTGR